VVALADGVREDGGMRRSGEAAILQNPNFQTARPADRTQAMIRPTKQIFLIAALFSAGPGMAADGPSCPMTLQVAEKPAAIPEGFKAFTSTTPPSEDLSAATKVALNQIMFSDGPPNEIAWLAPDRDERKYQVYAFSASAGKQTWLSCGYSNTGIMISMPLPADIKSCKVMHDPSVQGYPATGMTCR